MLEPWRVSNNFEPEEALSEKKKTGTTENSFLSNGAAYATN